MTPADERFTLLADSILKRAQRMTRHYTPRVFFRRAPNNLLQEYFARRGAFLEFDWSAVRKFDPEPILETFVTLEPELRDQMSQDFREIFARSYDGGFVKALIDEADFHKIDPDLSVRFQKMGNHLERALWVFLHRKDEYWTGASLFWRVDKLPAGQWQKRRQLPSRPGEVDEITVKNLEQALIAYFEKHEARGRHCVVEAYRRGDEEIFHAYPEDYRQTITHYKSERLEEQTNDIYMIKFGQHPPRFPFQYPTRLTFPECGPCNSRY